MHCVQHDCHLVQCEYHCVQYEYHCLQYEEYHCEQYTSTTVYSIYEYHCEWVFREGVSARSILHETRVNPGKSPNRII